MTTKRPISCVIHLRNKFVCLFTFDVIKQQSHSFGTWSRRILVAFRRVVNYANAHSFTVHTHRHQRQIGGRVADDGQSREHQPIAGRAIRSIAASAVVAAAVTGRAGPSAGQRRQVRHFSSSAPVTSRFRVTCRQSNLNFLSKFSEFVWNFTKFRQSTALVALHRSTFEFKAIGWSTRLLLNWNESKDAVLRINLAVNLKLCLNDLGTVWTRRKSVASIVAGEGNLSAGSLRADSVRISAPSRAVSFLLFRTWKFWRHPLRVGKFQSADRWPST